MRRRRLAMARWRSNRLVQRLKRCAMRRMHMPSKPVLCPVVFLANIGALAHFTARASFAANAFAAGGIAIGWRY